MDTFLTNLLLPLGLLASLVISPVSAEPKVVSWPIFKDRSAAPVPRLSKRNPFPLTLINAVNTQLYAVNVTLGTPGQTVQVQIDTGSSDLWVFGPQSCDPTASPCLGGAFDPSKSSSSSMIGQAGEFSISYVTPNSGVSGNYYSETVSIGGQTLTNATIAVALQASHVPTGIFGIGFDTFESSVSTLNVRYPNIIDVLMSEGLITNRAYSLWLDDLAASTGTILFGGYDTSKYVGELAVLPLQIDANTNIIDTFSVVWSSIAVTTTSSSTLLQSNDFPLAVVLDSGTTLTYLPTDIFAQLATFFNAVKDENYGWLVSCNLNSAVGTLDYGFGGPGGPIISVPFAELALPIFNRQTQPLSLTLSDGSRACSFGINPSTGSGDILFGDTFLRSAYVVYDLDNFEVGIAQTNFQPGAPHVQEIVAGTTADLPGSVYTGASAAQTATGLVEPGVGGGSITSGIAATGTQAATVTGGASGFGALSGVATTHTGVAITALGTADAGFASAAAAAGKSSTGAAPVVTGMAPAAVGGAALAALALLG